MNHHVVWLKVAVNETGLMDEENSQRHLDCNLLYNQGIDSELSISVKDVLERVIISLHDNDQKPAFVFEVVAFTIKMLIWILLNLVGFDLPDVVRLGCFVLSKDFMEEIFWLSSNALNFNNSIGLILAGKYLSKATFGNLSPMMYSTPLMEMGVLSIIVIPYFLRLLHLSSSYSISFCKILNPIELIKFEFK